MGFLGTPFFGILLAIITYEGGLLIYKKTKLPVFNPLLISIAIIITILLKFDISFETFNLGGSYISFFLVPATVVLAVPLYKQLNLLKANIAAILTGITAGCLTSVLSVWFFVKLFNIEVSIGLSLLPKSITTPIGIEVSRQIGGIPAVTVVAIIITGIIGAIISPLICKLFKIKDKIAVGIAIGTASHAIGTSKAVEIGEAEGAMSGLAIGVSGIITVFIVPILIRILVY